MASAPTGGRRRAPRSRRRCDAEQLRRSSSAYRRHQLEPLQEGHRCLRSEISSPKLQAAELNFLASHRDRSERTLRFHSGMTARQADGSIAGIGDITEQTRQVCENVKAAAEAAGGTLDDVCRVDVYVRNMEHFEAIQRCEHNTSSRRSRHRRWWRSPK